MSTIGIAIACILMYVGKQKKLEKQKRCRIIKINKGVKKMEITTRQDAECFVGNSGVADWEWENPASAMGFADWIWRNCDYISFDDYDHELANYITSIGQNLADYSL